MPGSGVAPRIPRHDRFLLLDGIVTAQAATHHSVLDRFDCRNGSFPVALSRFSPN